jgi:hypothetical protein
VVLCCQIFDWVVRMLIAESVSTLQEEEDSGMEYY